jgi:hypothetical protein
VAIHIKASTRGKYKARAKSHGRSVQAQASADLNNPNVSSSIKKRANFAKQAKKWRHTGRKTKRSSTRR